jgi:hypothetical protein
MSLEMAHKVILPPKKNYIPQFLKQRDINSYYATLLSYEADILAKLATSAFYANDSSACAAFIFHICIYFLYCRRKAYFQAK